MEDKKIHSFFATDSEGEQNFWTMKQRASAPGIPGYLGFYPMLRPMPGVPRISPIRHVLPQIPTRALNPRTAVSKASLREQFPSLPRPDVTLSNFIPGDLRNKEVIWKNDCRGSGQEILDQGETMTKVIDLDLLSSGNESARDMSVATARIITQSKEDYGFCLENNLPEDVGPKKETVYDTDCTLNMNQPAGFDNMEERASMDGNIMGVDDQKDISNSENGSSFSVLPVKSKETAAHANPIKLKIRCDFKQGQKELMAIIGSDSENDGGLSEATGSVPSVCQLPGSQSSLQGPGLPAPAPPSPQTVPVSSLSTGIIRPKTGRAKTNAELKKQLMEKRAVQCLKGRGDGGSRASSPANSHVDASSPASLLGNVPDVSAQTEGASTDSSDSAFDRSALSKTSQNGKETRCKNSSACVLNQEIPTFDLSPVETKWVVGDMLWTRVPGHPWWPCIVSSDPFQRIYIKIVSRGQKTSRQYHVQFFGEEGERGWALESTAVPFEGRTKFESFCDAMIKEHKKDRKSYTIAPNRRRAWEVAVADAEHAHAMPRVRRIEEYLTVHDGGEPVLAPSRDPQKGRVSAPIRSGSLPRKKRRLSSEPTAESPSLIKLPKIISNQCVVQYAVFCQKRRESVKNEHPEYDHRQVEDCLRSQWSRLDDETRSRFIPMGSDLTSLSKIMASVSLPNAPSGVKRCSRFIKTKQRPTLKKLGKEKCREVDATNEDDGKKKGILKDERQIPRQRTSGERELMKAGLQSRRSCSSLNNKIIPVCTTPASEMDASSPVALPLSVAASAMIPPKKRGRKPREAGPDLAETPELDAKEDEAAKKASESRITGRKETIVCNYDKNTEQELDNFDICFICEKSTKGIVKCRGLCRGSFHPSCLSRSSATGEQLLCMECATDSRKCFVCKNSDPKVVPCTVPDCGRCYHEECLGAFLPEGSTSTSPSRPFSCPLHSCFTCRLKKQNRDFVSEDDNDSVVLVTCVRCPIAFHLTDSCLSAGSLALTPRHIVCSRHFEPSKSQSLHTKTSCSWCFVCEKGGSLLNCDCCPGAYHSACLEVGVPPPSPRAWQCPDCSRGKTPLYGDLVWVKFGSYRWWPAEIYHPASLPANIQDLPHQAGEFPVCFFGSHDYLWIHHGRVFPFREGDKCCREADSRGTAKMFDKAMKEAIAVFRMLNPSARPMTKSTSDRNMDKSVTEKRETNRHSYTNDKQDDDDDYISGCGDVDGDDDDDAESEVLSSRKKLSPGGRKLKSTKVRPNNRILRQQSRVPSAMEVPRSSGNGRVPEMVNDHETKCYRCGLDGGSGSTILCDRPKCPKSFHLKCINKSKLPHGVWLCPWHHCDVCGKAAAQVCSCCPNSYCPDHIFNNIVFSHELGMICSKHKDVKINNDSLDTSLSPAHLKCSPSPAQKPRSRSKESVETREKKRRGTSVKKNLAVSRSNSAVLPHKLADRESGAGDSKSENGWSNVVKDVALPLNANGVTRKKRGVRSNALKYEASNEKSVKRSRPTRLGSEPSDSNFLSSISKKPALRLDSPTSDNSDDEFPQLVIDVPTI